MEIVTARRIAERVLGEEIVRCERFTTGLRHWVYDVEGVSGQVVVVRLSLPDNRSELAGGLRWTRRLREIDLPVAAVLAEDVEAAQPYLVLDRLPGTDLGNVFDSLSLVQLAAIATTVGGWQRNVARRLAPGKGYGFALDYGQEPKATWQQVLAAEIDSAENQIRSAGVVDPAFADLVRDRVASRAPELNWISPTPFLHDATTKNVIVHNGLVSGLVDVDTMAFGDPLYLPALTRMSLLSAGRPADYADALAAAMQPEVDQLLLQLYTAIHCLGFLSELGQTFNKSKPATVDPHHQALLEQTLGELLA